MPVEGSTSAAQPAASVVLCADARRLPLAGNTVDLVVTSPPYWRKRDYGHPDQIGQETTPDGYVASLIDCLTEWRRVLRPTGSVFLNVGDTYHRKSLAGIPWLIEAAAATNGWLIRNRIIWTKTRGMPDPAHNRLANRHEYILHLTPPGGRYYYDLHGYANHYGNGTNPGDVWQIDPDRSMTRHLAPFPQELVAHTIRLACPEHVCPHCGSPRQRIIERTRELDPDRPQARRAMELAAAARLTDAHIAAIQATGITDTGKAQHVHTGTGRNSPTVQRLAAEAKQALGGYFREYTFAKKITTGWTDCGCAAGWTPGAVLDPFIGTGTTLRAAAELHRTAIGIDLITAHTPTEHTPPRC